MPEHSMESADGRIKALESEIKDDLAMMLKYFTDEQNAKRLYEERHRSFSMKLYELADLARGKNRES